MPTCLHCGKVLVGRKNKKYCNNACKCNYRYNLTRDLSGKVCAHCGTIFTPAQDHPKYRFCSMSCKDQHTKTKESYKEVRRQYQKQDRLANPIKYQLRDQQRYKANKALFYAANARRRAAQLQQTPKWDLELTQFVIEEAHTLREHRNLITNCDWHVDHIIPLKGVLVSGLHVWNNFAVIPKVENLRKGNRYSIYD